MAKAGMARAVGAEDTPEVRLEEVWAFVVPDLPISSPDCLDLAPAGATWYAKALRPVIR